MAHECGKLVIEYELDRCVDWIQSNNFSKVCLQFPDELLTDSTDIALYIDSRVENKTYILGDTSYGSCCVDFVACQHVGGDGIIHFGHTCFSQPHKPLSLPVLYILPKKYDLDLDKLNENLNTIDGTVVLFYEETYDHLRGDLKKRISENIIVPQLMYHDNRPEKESCGKWCEPSKSSHEFFAFSRGYCLPSNESFAFVFIGGTAKVISNLLLASPDDLYQYTDKDGLQLRGKLNLLKKLSFQVEKIREASTIGLIVGTLAVQGYLEAISHVKKLCRKAKKKCYLISVGKPTVAKLSNFSEIDVFVLISCLEADFLPPKSTYQPVVSLLELELALDKRRTWDQNLSPEYSHCLPGGAEYYAKDIDDSDIDEEGSECSFESKELSIRPELGVIHTSALSSLTRTWDGLEINSEAAVELAQMGLKGSAQGYNSEPVE